MLKYFAKYIYKHTNIYIYYIENADARPRQTDHTPGQAGWREIHDQDQIIERIEEF